MSSEELMEKKVRDVMREVVTIPATVTYKEALTHLIAQRRNSALAVDEHGTFVGYVDAGTLLRGAMPEYLRDDPTAARFAENGIMEEMATKVADEPLADFIDTDAVAVEPDDSLVYATVLSIQKGQGRVPVVDEQQRPVGVLTRTELKQVLGTYLDIPGCFED